MKNISTLAFLKQFLSFRNMCNYPLAFEILLFLASAMLLYEHLLGPLICGMAIYVSLKHIFIPFIHLLI